MKTTKSSGSRIAGAAALLSLGLAIFNLVIGSPPGALPVNVLLFLALAVIFAALWWTTRPRKPY